MKMILKTLLLTTILPTQLAFAVRENSPYLNFDRFQLGIDSAVAVRRMSGWQFSSCPSATVDITPGDATNADAIFSVVMASYWSNTAIKIYGEYDTTYPDRVNIDYLIVEDH